MLEPIITGGDKTLVQSLALVKVVNRMVKEDQHSRHGSWGTGLEHIIIPLCAEAE